MITTDSLPIVIFIRCESQSSRGLLKLVSSGADVHARVGFIDHPEVLWAVHYVIWHADWRSRITCDKSRASRTYEPTSSRTTDYDYDCDCQSRAERRDASRAEVRRLRVNTHVFAARETLWYPALISGLRRLGVCREVDLTQWMTWQ